MATHLQSHSDTQAEHDALESIVQEAHSLLARMDEVKQRFDTVGHRIERLNEGIEQSKSMLTDAAKHVEHAVHHTASNLNHLAHDCDTKYHELFGMIGSWCSEIKGTKDHFDQSAKQALAAVDHSHTVSQQMLDQVKHVAATFVDSSKERVHKLHDHVSNLSKQFEAEAHPAMTGFDEFLQHMREQSEIFANNTHGHVEKLHHQTDEHVHAELINPISEHTTHAAEFLANVGHADITGAVTHLMSQGREVVEDQIKSVIGDLTDAVGREIDSVSDAIHKSGGENQLVREALKPVFDVIDGLIAPIEDTIGNVRSVASAVGFDV